MYGSPLPREPNFQFVNRYGIAQTWYRFSKSNPAWNVNYVGCAKYSNDFRACREIVVIA